MGVQDGCVVGCYGLCFGGGGGLARALLVGREEAIKRVKDVEDGPVSSAFRCWVGLEVITVESGCHTYLDYIY